jgi:tRNA-intron endonuclease
MSKRRKMNKKTKKKTTKKTKKSRGFKAVLKGRTITSDTTEATTLYGKSRFGEIVNKKVNYSFIEALYLVDKGKMRVYEKGRKISFDKLFEKARKFDKNIWPKFCVYGDIRTRGYILKTALKFGADFRVYEKGVKPGQEHAKWILFPVHETSALKWHEFAAKNRVAHSTKKNLLIAIVDEEGSITYYEVKWLRP